MRNPQSPTFIPSPRSITYFVHIHGFYAENGQLLPCEIGFAEILGTESVKLLVVDMSDLDFTHEDSLENYKLHRYCHGVPVPTYANLHWDYRFDVKSRDLASHMTNTYDADVVFAVKGYRQKFLLQSITTNDVIDIEGSYGWIDRMKVDRGRAPNLHKRFHSDRFEKRCAVKIAWTYADLIRDKIFGGYELKKSSDDRWETNERPDTPPPPSAPIAFHPHDEEIWV